MKHAYPPSFFDPCLRKQAKSQTQVLQRTGRTSELASRLATALHDDAEQFRTLPEVQVQTACRAGCAHCCHQPATAFPFEALHIAQSLQKHLSPKDLETLRESLRKRVAGLTNRSVRQSIQDKSPCPFLKNSRCSIYNERPLTCRMAHSLAVKRCEAALQGDRRKAQIPISFELQSGMSGILEGVFTKMPQLKLDANLYELCSAVETALTNPEAGAQWARGDRTVFKAAVLDDT